MQKQKLSKLIAFIMGALFLLSTPMTAYADAGEAPYYGFGTTNLVAWSSSSPIGERPDGRMDVININDYHTDSWERFIFNYLFESGGNYRYDLGQPTTFTGHVPNDVYSANIRRDKNVTVIPPSYGVFSGNVATQQTNYLFELPLDPAFSQFLSQAFQDDPHLIPMFDTLMMGVNAPITGNAMSMYNVDQTGVLSSTSIGGQDVSLIGANNATRQYIQQGNDWYYQSGNSSSTVTTLSQGEFLPPTSIQ